MTNTAAADQLKSWRAAASLSQEQAALKLGVSCSTLQKWEQGQHTPRGLYLERVQKICGTLQAKKYEDRSKEQRNIAILGGDPTL